LKKLREHNEMVDERKNKKLQIEKNNLEAKKEQIDEKLKNAEHLREKALEEKVTIA
jgi:hypothetical protein